MNNFTKPANLNDSRAFLRRAFIEEQDCIGCTKCLDVCPVDAIVGAQKFIHTVIEADCIGCEKCVPVCPVDCIRLLPDLQALAPEYVRRLASRRKDRIAREAEVLEVKSSQDERKAYLAKLLNKR